MTHKTIINICLTLIALCWTMAIQAQTATVDGINYSLNADAKTAEVTGITISGDIVIPEKITVNGVEYSVTSIGYGAFRECKALTSVKMPSVTSIGSCAFYRCSITSVDMPLVSSLGSEAFYGCSSITSVAMPSVTSIGRHAFQFCSSLTSVAMPSVTSIGNGAFMDCNIDKLSLPMTLTSIGNNCFGRTSEITFAATTPAALGTNVFWGNACTFLKKVEWILH